MPLYLDVHNVESASRRPRIEFTAKGHGLGADEIYEVQEGE